MKKFLVFIMLSLGLSQDTISPELTNLEISPLEASLNEGFVDIQFNFSFEDDLTGISMCGFLLHTPYTDYNIWFQVINGILEIEIPEGIYLHNSEYSNFNSQLGLNIAFDLRFTNGSADLGEYFVASVEAWDYSGNWLEILNGPSNFSCGDGQCIPSWYTCDSWSDCSNEMDEIDCGNEFEFQPCNNLELMGFDSSFILNADDIVEDLNPPELTNLEISPLEASLNEGFVDIQFNFSFEDDLTGISMCGFLLHTPYTDYNIWFQVINGILEIEIPEGIYLHNSEYSNFNSQLGLNIAFDLRFTNGSADLGEYFVASVEAWDYSGNWLEILNGPSNFSCGDGQCIPSWYTCDSWSDCSNEMDEIDCGNEFEFQPCNNLELMGFDSSFILNADDIVEDLNPPELTNFILETQTVNLNNGFYDLDINMVVSDTQSGVMMFGFEYNEPTWGDNIWFTNQNDQITIQAPELLNIQNFEYFVIENSIEIQLTIRLNKYSNELGNYFISAFELFDFAGNSLLVTDFDETGFNNSFIVINEEIISSGIVDDLPIITWSWNQNNVLYFTEEATSQFSNGDVLYIHDEIGVNSNSCATPPFIGDVIVGQLDIIEGISSFSIELIEGSENCEESSFIYPGYIDGNEMKFSYFNHSEDELYSLLPFFSSGSSIFGESFNDTIKFRYFNANENIIYSIENDLIFENDMIIGSAISPFILGIGSEINDNIELWELNINQFQFNGTITLEIENTSINDVIGAFINEECRGIAYPIISPFGELLFPLMVYSNPQVSIIKGLEIESQSNRLNEPPITNTRSLKNYNIYKNGILIDSVTNDNFFVDENNNLSETNCYQVTISNPNLNDEFLLSNEVCIDIANEPCSVLGDSSGDGFLNVLDIVEMVSHILGNSTMADDALSCSDINQDGTLNVIDIVMGVEIILGN